MLRHSGYSRVLGRIRQKFWIANGVSAVRFYLKDCVFCDFRRAREGKQLMAPLPIERITSGGRPFEVTGVDFWGPEFVFGNFDQSKSRKKVKRYGCLFTCFATRAVHLEICNSLTTDSFLCALNRFLASRGFSTKKFWSDQGTNFVGAHNEIKDSVQKIDERKLVDSLAPRGLDWTFSPPRSPHQSGEWEVMVRETKLVLHSVYADNSYRTLNEEEFLTYVKEVEAILNSRPPTALTDDPNDFGYLSPMSILNLCLEPSLPLRQFLEAEA